MKVYNKSVNKYKNSEISMVRGDDADYLKVSGKNPGFIGKSLGRDELLAPLSAENAKLLRELFPFTAPKPILCAPRTIGVGDRLGIATPGHIRAICGYDALPVFAQQSIRELNLTHRTYADVIDAATFSVFREGFVRGFGADGDHVKADEEIQYAINSGCTMITLDCSEHIDNVAANMADSEVAGAYGQGDKAQEERYCGKDFCIQGETIRFSEAEFKRNYLIYNAAIEHVARVYHAYIEGRPVDFEVSIDETMTPTTPGQHFFVASELMRRGIKIATVAPRFCGEFQKGIDYIGDLDQFEAELKVHASIAEHFGYKLSIHSGSDKFSVFPIIGRVTGGRFHVKTAGTNWLEAMAAVAKLDPGLYREIHRFALEAFYEASKYYHVTTQLGRIPRLASLADDALPGLFEQNDARQLIHITYGLILDAKDDNGKPLFRDRLYKLWRDHDELYAQRLEKHICKHLQLLYSGIK